MVTIKGKMIEVGFLNSGNRGVVLQVEGETVEIGGLTEDECKTLARNAFDSELEIKISKSSA